MTFLIFPDASILLFNVDRNGSRHAGKGRDVNVSQTIMPKVLRRIKIDVSTIRNKIAKGREDNIEMA